jgi:hypothetical protein
VRGLRPAGTLYTGDTGMAPHLDRFKLGDEFKAMTRRGRRCHRFRAGTPVPGSSGIFAGGNGASSRRARRTAAHVCGVDVQLTRPRSGPPIVRQAFEITGNANPPAFVTDVFLTSVTNTGGSVAPVISMGCRTMGGSDLGRVN